ncbi:MAG: hypothetical protein NTX72_04555 [Candidatus Uhrbacteria bacterium]|nr:hypothetical protein [Candidatus Uhrbacteria bacterium]
MKRLSTLVLVVSILGLLGDLVYLYNEGFDPNKHIPFLYPLVLLFFWGCLRMMERFAEKHQMPNEPTPIQRYINDADGVDKDKIPSHAKMRANTPDGLG